MKKVYQENERKEPRADNGKEVSAPKEAQKGSSVGDEPDEGMTSQKKHAKKRMRV